MVTAIYALLLLTALVVGFFNAVHLHPLDGGLEIADRYWTQFWLTSYQDGYVRRALLGSLLRLGGNGLPIAVLNGLQLAVALVLAALYAGFAHRFFARHAGPVAARLMTVAFCASPLTFVLFETVGDPLQVALVLLLAGYGLSRLSADPRLAAGLLLGACLVALLVHEASLFFTVPFAVHVLWRRGLVAKAALSLALVALLSGLVAVLLSSSAGTPSFFALGANGTRILPWHDATPTFKAVLAFEMQANFGSPLATATTAAKAVRILVVPAILFGLIACLCGRAAAAGWLRLFGYFLAASLPLYVIAHDWGRFAAFSFWLALIAASLAAPPRPAENAGPEALRRLPVVMLLGMVLVCDLLWTDYRIAGVKYAVFGLAPLALVWGLEALRRRAGRA